tara:strand:- start:3310 stop:3417 length:108 start_codon:yes stop_codon:yes gene_type:complete
MNRIAFDGLLFGKERVSIPVEKPTLAYVSGDAGNP